MWKWMIVLALLFTGLPVQLAWADEEVEMQLDIPFQSILKGSQWTKVNVSLTSQTQDISGTLHLKSKTDQNSHFRSLTQAVSITKGQPKSYSFMIPADFLMQDELIVQLIDENEILATKELERQGSREGKAVVVLDQNRNAFHFMNMTHDGVDQYYGRAWNQSVVIHMQPNELPADSLLLKHLDVLAIGNLSADAIRPDQLEAIKQWVQGGGVVLVSTGANASGAATYFADWINVSKNPGTTTDIAQLSRLAKLAKSPVESLEVYNREKPLFIEEKVGIGKVLLVNYDVSAEPLASWQNNRDLWKKLILQYQLFDGGSGQYPSEFASGRLTELSRMIPGVNMPRVEWLAGIWMIYIVVIAALLYLVLKRKDRREWAWGIIPASALVLMMGVYVIGKSLVADGNSSYNVSSINIIDKETANVETAASFLVMAGGNYSVHSEEGYTAVPIGMNNNNRTWITDALIEESGNGESTFHYENVPYLTLRQSFASGMKTGIGSFVSNLKVEGDHVRGTVMNQTSFDLEELYLTMGLQRIPLGALKKGEEKQVDVEMQEVFAPDEPEYNLTNDRDKMVEQIKLDLSRAYQGKNMYLIGHSSQPLQILTLDVTDKHEHHFQFIKQQITLKDTKNNRIVYPYGTRETYVLSEQGKTFSTGVNQWEVSQGSVTFGFMVEDDHLDVQKVEVPLDSSSYVPFKKEVFHAGSGNWKELTAVNARIELEGEELKNYLTQEGHLLLRISNSSDQRLTMPGPSFRVEGEEK